MEDLQKAVFATETGMSVDSYNRAVAEWFSEARDPHWNKPYTDLAYLPMVQLLRYLRGHGFKTFIVTGGTQKFVRAFAKQVYGLESYKVVGTTFKTKYLYSRSGQPYLMIEPKLGNLSYRDGKPESIDMFIGKKPIVAFGNSVGDRRCLNIQNHQENRRYRYLILHDYAKTECAYGPVLGFPPSQLGNEFSQKLYEEAIESGWNIVSMKKDWKKIFTFD